MISFEGFGSLRKESEGEKKFMNEIMKVVKSYYKNKLDLFKSFSGFKCYF